MHGLLAELFVIGIILVWLDSRRHKNDHIERNKENLWDTNTLKDPQIIKQKIGNLKRLNKDGVFSIDVTNLLLINTEVKNITFRKAKVFGLKFINCKIFDFELINCKVNSGDFSDSVFKRSNLSNSYLKSANFTNAILKGINLRGANLLRAKFIDANLESADLRDTDLDRTVFSNAVLRNANINGCINISIEALSQANNLDYLKADNDIIKKLKALRGDMKQNDNRRRGN